MRKLSFESDQLLGREQLKTVKGGAHIPCDEHYDCPAGQGCCFDVGLCFIDSYIEERCNN